MKVSSLRMMTMAVAGAAAMVLAPLASATAVNGVANINGATNVSVTTVTFLNNADVSGLYDVAGPTQQTGSFAGLTSAGGHINSLSGGPFSGPVSITDFANFVASAGNIQFDLTSIPAGFGTGACSGSGANNVGNECTPMFDRSNGNAMVTSCPSGHTCVTSPFTLVQGVGSVLVDLTLLGNTYFMPPGPSGGVSATTGAFTTQQVVQAGTNTALTTITGVLAALNSGGTVSASYSATFTATSVPEPATAFLGLSGLLIAAGLARRRRRS
jgi:hypothetical protein